MNYNDIQPNDIIGSWKILKREPDRAGHPYFLCKCECGAVRQVDGYKLQDGRSLSCSSSCTAERQWIGRKYGELTVQSFDRSQKGFAWCICSCGKRKSIRRQSLEIGKTKSCGCKSAAFVKEAEGKIGEVYGKLTIFEPVLKDGKRYSYKCKCECGNTTTVLGYNLFSGHTTSCGCISSKANEEMGRILESKGIIFKREYIFSDCKDKGYLRFDFAIFNEIGEVIGLIENNGSQHYSSRGSGWDTPERIVEIQKRDYIKQKFAEDNQIPLLTIPYQFFNELEKFLISSDFWQIIIRSFND